MLVVSECINQLQYKPSRRRCARAGR